MGVGVGGSGYQGRGMNMDQGYLGTGQGGGVNCGELWVSVGGGAFPAGLSHGPGSGY